MNSDIDIRLLEKYLNGEITREQVLDLDGNAVSEDVLNTNIRNFEAIKLGVKAIGLKEDLKQIENEIEEEKRSKTGWLKYAVAATIIFLGVVSFLVGYFNQSPSFSDYFAPFDDLTISRDALNTKPQQAMKLYAVADYEKALALFEETPRDSLTGELSFYAGISAMVTENFSLALTYLTLAGEKASEEYSEPVRWYTALCYWQLDDIDKSKTLLNQVQMGEYQYEKAKELLERLTD